MRADKEIIFEQEAGIHQVGGLLILTSQRLLFQPIDVSAVDKLLQIGLKLIGGHTAALVGHVVSAASKYVDSQRRSLPADAIIAVGPGSSRDKLAVETNDGYVFEFAIAASLYTPRWSSSNEEVRDRLIQEIDDFIR
jgi:hypothetical protein